MRDQSPSLRFSMMISPDAIEDELSFARQLGVPCVYTWVRDDQRDLASLMTLRHKVEDAGLDLYMVGNMTVAKNAAIHLALPERDAVIEAYRAFVENLGRAGIGVTTFTWEPDQVWSSSPQESRGAIARHVDMDDLRQRPWTHGRAYTEAELWENLGHFLERMMPVAEAAGVRMALHPNDPPAHEPIAGVPCLIRNADAYRKAFAIADSHALGMEFCCGCWLEGGCDGFGDLLAGLREFVADDRVLIVHFRNVSAPLPRFTETFLDNGYMDMYQVMRTLVATGYRGTVTLDHTPRFVAGYAAGAGTGYAIGYMRALLERAIDELSA
jgi:mannonate dehydratase